MSSLTTTDRLKELLPQLFNTKKLEGDYYLRFQLTDEILGLIDLKYIQESLTIKGDRITAVPNLPEYAIGLMSSRNQVFVAIDLAHLVGLAPETVNLREYQTIVLQTDLELNDSQFDQANLFGLTVKKIEGIMRILPDRFTTDLENIPDVLRPFVRNSVVQKSLNIESNLVEKQFFLLDITQLIDRKINAQL
ncbi:chemotaxis protein CheW [Waterburya agarophytonicola K14]|uniref:Chemotaxis protein CheW n=1 Tax=Waterburya agarophytonicola KI4 TaxID=2874699 RepID=A0A964BRI0_9CYAN|nr:chemotaxis protein CheW [Waterburya agarophytonicola]MCC0177546.1 chemotaxis protein CheW [Waterburya agarophytonicola KI4]